jgi:tRNA1(Val) A37 N6-methylase TrmN6
MEKVTISCNNDQTEIHIYSDLSDYISKMIKYYNNFYEYNLLLFLQNNFNNQKNIIDIGANIGNHSLFFAKYINCKNIYAFEPYSKNIELFNINLANYKEKCFLYEVALSNVNGKMNLYNTENNNNGGYLCG